MLCEPNTPHLLFLTVPLLQLALSSTPVVSETGLPVYGLLGNPHSYARIIHTLAYLCGSGAYTDALPSISRRRAHTVCLGSPTLSRGSAGALRSLLVALGESNRP